MTVRSIKVMVIDDNTKRAEAWAKQLRKLRVPGLKVDAPNNHAVARIIKSLNQRRLKARKNRDWRSEACDLDGMDVLLIDFDLIEFAEDPAEFATGEELAYLARVLSTANVICVVNQFGTNRFDLTLSADASKRSDLDIGSVQLTNPGLWKGPDFWSGYRPWQWPVLPSEVGSYLKRVDDARRNSNSHLLQFFGFDASCENPSRTLPTAALSYFKDSPNKITLGAAGIASGFVHPRDAKWLQKDLQQNARVCAAVVHKWLERWVLARQDLLVDVPHLIARKPWLLKKPATKTVWQQSVSTHAAGLLVPAAKPHRFARSIWLTKPAYWGEDINATRSVGFPGKDWNYDAVPELVFREDVSNFGLRTESLEFVCDFGSAYDLRYICDPKRTRSAKGAANPKDVDYTPSIRLAM
jgi:hypothetical protein